MFFNPFTRRREGELFKLFLLMGQNLKAAGDIFVKKMPPLAGVHEFAESLQAVRKKSSRYTSKIFSILAGTFYAPFERDDLIKLALSLDSIAQSMEICAQQFSLQAKTRIKTHAGPNSKVITSKNKTAGNKYTKKFAVLIYTCTVEIAVVLDQICQKKLFTIYKQLSKIKNIEKQSDDLFYICIEKLYDDAYAGQKSNFVDVVKKKELYSSLKEVVNSCLNFTKTLQVMIIRNA